MDSSKALMLGFILTLVTPLGTYTSASYPQLHWSAAKSLGLDTNEIAALASPSCHLAVMSCDFLSSVCHSVDPALLLGKERLKADPMSGRSHCAGV